MAWQDISSAPKDGREVWVRRVYEGRVVREGWAVWGVNSDDAPMRQWGDGGLDGPIPPDHAYADKERWLTTDRRFSFPTPTEWTPAPPISAERGLNPLPPVPDPSTSGLGVAHTK